MNTTIHTYETERICKFRIGIAEVNGSLKQIDGLEPESYEEEIIRCRDCKYARREDPMRCYQFRFKDNGAYQGVNYVDPDGFCAWAQKVD